MRYLQPRARTHRPLKLENISIDYAYCYYTLQNAHPFSLPATNENTTERRRSSLGSSVAL
jgi:hypothetical protein